MFTQSMPSLAQSLNGVMPAAAIRQMMQTFGNCNQPLEHRGPVSVNATPGRREAGPAYFGGGAWSPDSLANLLNGGTMYNNNAFIDSPVNNTFFGGDNFLFNNSAEFISNFFPTTIVMGTPGATGATGAAGAAGAAGASGAAGSNGVDGAPGAAGAFGPAGAQGQRGAAGPAGSQGQRGFDGLDGLPGRPGRDGRDGIGGGYTLSERSRGVPLRGVLDDVSVQVTGTVNVPVFDPETCDVTETPIDIAANATVQVTRADYSIPVPTYRLDPKQAYP